VLKVQVFIGSVIFAFVQANLDTPTGTKEQLVAVESISTQSSSFH
jgi:hypothetical protein